MSLKVLCFGDKGLLTHVISTLRAQTKPQTDDEIIVDNINVNGKHFLTFSISNSELIGSQSVGTNALLYLLSTQISIYEQKDFLFGIFKQKSQFQGIPVVIAYSKEKQLSLKEIVSHFELFKVKDRASMIKEIDENNIETSRELFKWIQSQNQLQRRQTFDAEPKVVKMKNKYRQSLHQSTENKYQALIKDKKMKGLSVKEQELTYIGQEKQRIKNQNMEKQLMNFNKNKKKMAPYDIKATPNPKITANLHFFLKDSMIKKDPEVNIKVQTDQFKQKHQQKQFKQKKTGINEGTQIQTHELFSFDIEVQPILKILSAKALEAATLEIQQEEQTLKILKYRNTFSQRRKKQKKHEEDKIKAEIGVIKGKQELLKAEKKKDERNKGICQKVQIYDFANTFLGKIYHHGILTLFYQNHYPNTFQTELKSIFLQEIFNKTYGSYQKLQRKSQSLNAVFQYKCIEEPIKKSSEVKHSYKEKNKIYHKRSINRGNQQREVYMLYEHHEQKKFTSFSKYLDKELQGSLEEHVRKTEQEIHIAEMKVKTGEVDDTFLHNILDRDNKNFGKDHKNFAIEADSDLCFSLTNNKYERVAQKNLIGSILCFDGDHNLLEAVKPPRTPSFITYMTNLHSCHSPINMDTGLRVTLSCVPEAIKSFLCVYHIPKFNPAIQEQMKYAQYGVEFYASNVGIHRCNIASEVKWDEILGEDGEEKCFCILGYHVYKKTPDYWCIQELRHVSKPQLLKNDYLHAVCTFYKKSFGILSQVSVQFRTEKVQSRSRRRSQSSNISNDLPKTLKPTTRIFKPIMLSLQTNFSSNLQKLKQEVEGWKQLAENCQEGWELCGKNGSPITSNDSFKNFSKVGDLLIKKIQPPRDLVMERQTEIQEQNQ